MKSSAKPFLYVGSFGDLGLFVLFVCVWVFRVFGVETCLRLCFHTSFSFLGFRVRMKPSANHFLVLGVLGL